MGADLLERLLLSLAIIAAGMAAYLTFNRLTLARAGSKVRRLKSYRPGLPAVVYFTTPTCTPCKTMQRPTLRRLQENFGKWFQVIEVDASAHPNLANEWGVVSVPTTFIIDAAGKPRHVNHGVATAEKLIQQLELEDYSI